MELEPVAGRQDEEQVLSHGLRLAALWAEELCRLELFELVRRILHFECAIVSHSSTASCLSNTGTFSPTGRYGGYSEYLRTLE